MIDASPEISSASATLKNPSVTMNGGKQSFRQSERGADRGTGEDGENHRPATANFAMTILASTMTTRFASSIPATKMPRHRQAVPLGRDQIRTQR
jgi:hypothetical protein